MYLQSIASAFPSQSYTQRDCWDILQRSEAAKSLSHRAIEQFRSILLGNSGIAKRHFALDDIENVFALDATTLNRQFEHHAPRLSEAALRRALEKNNTPIADIDALFICTCTGYLCPGITSHVAELLGLDSSTYLHDIVGLGCGAAIPMLRAASHFLAAHPEATVACIAVEICSSAFFLNEDPGVITSVCIFGDGASATLWSNQPNAYRCHQYATVHLPEQREKIRFVNDGGKLKNQLHRSVPIVVAQTVEQLHTTEVNGHAPHLISHSGGRDVIRSIRKKLPQYPLTETTAILRDYGNMSSPSVLIALERYLEEGGDHPHLWLTAFGAGFCAHSCFLEKKPFSK